MAKNRTNKPWGYEDLWAKTDKYVGKLIHIKNGESLSLQYHDFKEETVRVVKGRLYVEFQKINEGGQKVHEYYVLREGESLHVPPKQVHRFYAEAGPVDVIEVSTPELDDVKLELNEVTAHRYTKMGFGEGEGAGFAGGTSDGTVGFVRLEYSGGDWNQDFRILFILSLEAIVWVH